MSPDPAASTGSRPDSGHGLDPGARNRCPWVGPRPYDLEERDLFFGRRKDAAFICDKVFSSPLTLLHAPSGVGKSSVLRTLVLPGLKAKHAIPVYFDAWGADYPLLALKAMLAEAARSLGINDSELEGAPKIVELLSLMNSKDDRTVVLVLDQFDEYLVSPTNMDVLRRELEEVVGDRGPDARILISLRQELLASLEAFRSGALDPFASTYQLEPLSEAGVRDAIIEPAAVEGMRCDPRLADVLIEDFRQLAKDSEPGAVGSIELPILQVVCARLWETARRAHSNELLKSLYRRQGGAEKILRAYVRSIMPKSPWRQMDAARLLVPLALPSGMKRSYSVEDLAALTRIRKHRVEKEIKALKEAKLLRSRIFRGKERVELQHDALTKIIAPWRQRIFGRRKWSWRVGKFAMSLLCLGFVWWVYGLMNQDRDIAERVLLRACSEQADGASPAEKVDEAKRGLAFDLAATILLQKHRPELVDKVLQWRRLPAFVAKLLWQEDRPFHEYKYLVDHYGSCMPKTYGVAQASAETSADKLDDDWPLTTYVSKESSFEPNSFAQRWHDLVPCITRDWGIPVPAQVRSVVGGQIPKGYVRVVAPGQESRWIYIGNTKHEDVIIRDADVRAAGAAQRFFDHFYPGGRRVSFDFGNDEQWWITSRWSVPAWRLNRVTAIDPAGVAARVVLNDLVANPEYLLGPGAIGVLLENAEQFAPGTVREAKLARGDRLPSDLLEIIKKNKGWPARFADVLDALSNYDHREPDSTEVVEQVLHELDDPHAGPVWKLPSAGPDGGMTLDGRAHMDLTPYAARYDSTPYAEVEELLQQSGDSTALEWDRACYGLSRPQKSAAQDKGTRWITADRIDEALEEFKPQTKKWISDRFSVPTLKLILREVAAPADGNDTSTLTSSRPIAPLIRSLVFWTAMKAEQKVLVDEVRNTASYLNGPPSRFAVSFEPVKNGLSALQKDNPEGARSTFLQAMQSDPRLAIREFRFGYAQLVRDEARRNVEKRCRAFERTPLTSEQQAALEDLLDSSDSEKQQKLRLCKLYAESAPAVARGIIDELLEWRPQPDDWNPKYARSLGYYLLTDLKPDAPDQHLDKSKEFLTSAARRYDKAPAVVSLFNDIVRHCKEVNLAAWCWNIAEYVAATQPAKLDLALASILATRERPEDANRALDLVKRHRETHGWLSRDDEPRMKQIEAAAQYALALGGNGQAFDESEKYYMNMSMSKSAEPAVVVDAYAKRVDLLLARDRRVDAEEILDEALANWPNSPELLERQLIVSLGSGELDNVSDVGRQATRARSKPRGPAARNRLLFIESLAQILTANANQKAISWFLLSDHEHTNEVALLWDTYTAGESRENSQSYFNLYWPEDVAAGGAPGAGAGLGRQLALLKSGDTTAWRALLMGYFLGRVPREDLFGPLESPVAFNEAGWQRLPITREGMLTEALFYDACRAHKDGDDEQMKSLLDQIEKRGSPRRHEFWLARFMRRAPPPDAP